MRRKSIVIAVIAGAIALACIVYFFYPNRPSGSLNAARILAARQVYVANLKAKRVPVPPTVSVQELINRQLLTPSDVSGFTARDVTVSLASENRWSPDTVLIRARLADGSQVVLLGNGSIQQLTADRASELDRAPSSPSPTAH
jgi:hypothetical protein